uniref:AI-2E family transporter n=1 Tax=uncultured Draconibacterium sp. TaxID=1573823 RepID=UPI003217D66B
MKDLKITNTLLLIIVIPLVFYIIKILSFIFIPLVLAMFIALLFLPLMRWLKRKNVPKPVNIAIVIAIILGALKTGGELIQLTSNEIISADTMFFEKAKTKITNLVVLIEEFFGFERLQGDNIIMHYFQENNIMEKFGSTLDFVTNTLSMTLMTVFFVVLLLSESINFQKILNQTIFKIRHSSIKTFIRIERDIIKFVKVKFIISLFTGVGFSLVCMIFGVSFPIFWGLFAFAFNFIQMIGSVISVIALSLFAFVELDPTGTLLFFVIAITMVQVIMGGILEPIFMGKTFALNVITVLIMLMLWGYLWNVPGLIMSIPITVFIKIVFDQFPRTKIIAELMAGEKPQIKLKRK